MKKQTPQWLAFHNGLNDEAYDSRQKIIKHMNHRIRNINMIFMLGYTIGFATGAIFLIVLISP